MRVELLDKACKPVYTHQGDACMDCFARTDCDWIYKGGIYTTIVPLGFKVEVPLNYVLLLFSRSGMGFKENITLINSVGVIDFSFAKEVMIKLIKYDSDVIPEPIFKGQRVAQMMLVYRPEIYLEVVEHIAPTTRGDGFGSSGK